MNNSSRWPVFRGLPVFLSICLGWAAGSAADRPLWVSGGVLLGPGLMTFTDDRHLFTAGDQGIKAWDTAAGQFLGTWTEPFPDRYSSMFSALSPDGRRILWGRFDRYGTVVTRLPDGVVEGRYPPTSRTAEVPNSLAWLPESDVLAVAYLSGELTLVRLTDGTAITPPAESTLVRESAGLLHVQAANGTDLLIASLDHTECWRMNAPKVLWSAPVFVSAVDGARQRGLVVGTTNLGLVNLADGSVQSGWAAATEDGHAWAFSPDGRRLAVGRRGASVRLSTRAFAIRNPSARNRCADRYMGR